LNFGPPFYRANSASSFLSPPRACASFYTSFVLSFLRTSPLPPSPPSRVIFPCCSFFCTLVIFNDFFLVFTCQFLSSLLKVTPTPLLPRFSKRDLPPPACLLCCPPPLGTRCSIHPRPFPPSPLCDWHPFFLTRFPPPDARAPLFLARVTLTPFTHRLDPRSVGRDPTFFSVVTPRPHPTTRIVFCFFVSPPRPPPPHLPFANPFPLSEECRIIFCEQ